MNNPVKKILFLSFFFVTVLVGSFTVLYYSIQSEQAILRQTQNLTQLQIQYTLKNEQISNDFKRQNYDQLNILQKEFLSQWKKISAAIEKDFSNNLSIIVQVQELEKSLQQEQLLYTKYESDKAVLANSIFYLTAFETKEQYTPFINRILRNVIYYHSSLQETKKDVQLLLNFIEKHPAKQTKLLKRHTQLFYARYEKIATTIDQIKALENFQKLRELEKLFVEAVNKERNTRNIINTFMGFLSFIMLIGFLLSYYKVYKDKIHIMQLQEENNEQVQLLHEHKKALDESSIISKTDLRGNITYVNEKFLNISGYSKEELLGQPHNIIRHPDMSKEFYENMWRTLKKQKIFQGIIKNRNKQGEAYYVDSTVVPILDIHGNTTEYFAIRYDVTDLINAKEEAQTADKAKSTFLATMSHELRTPLNAVIGFSNILMIKKDISPTVLINYLEKINVAGKHLLSTINNILDFSKIESNQMDLDAQEFAIDKLLKETLTLIEIQAHEKNISITAEIDEHTMLLGDKQLLKQVILNILSNAVKFTPKNKKISITAAEEKQFYKLSLCDEGIGLTQEEIEKLFNPFSQIKEHQNESIKGTGLGLAISKKIMQLHHGDIKVTSTKGEGSCFTLYIPIK